MFPRLVVQVVDMKTKAFSRYAGLLASLLSCAFLVCYLWRHGFAFPLHKHAALLPAFVPHDHLAGDDRHPVIEAPSSRRPPSVDYIDLASKYLVPRRLYNVYPDYNGRTWRQRWYGSQQPCLGPRGVNVNSNPDDMLQAWVVDPIGMRLVSSYF